MSTSDTHYTSKDGKKHKMSFPIEYFPEYKVHHIGTEAAILYRKKYDVSPLPQTEYCKKDRKANFHVCGIVLHLNNKELGIYSVYRCHKSDPTQLFQYEFITTDNIIGGDYNIHHPAWGSSRSTPDSDEFVNLINVSDLKIINATQPQYTRNTEKDGKSYIDLTVSSRDLEIKNWYVNTLNHNQQFSDHLEIYYTVQLNKNYGYSEGPENWNLSSKKWPKYKQLLSHKLKTIKFHKDPHIHTMQLTHLMTSIATATIGTKKYRIGWNPWWNKQ